MAWKPPIVVGKAVGKHVIGVAGEERSDAPGVAMAGPRPPFLSDFATIKTCPDHLYASALEESRVKAMTLSRISASDRRGWNPTRAAILEVSGTRLGMSSKPAS